ncbi:hypothetical protein [Porphyrobacter sp. CACIAM 03H1]|uniref:hypothetical protein n=1 Tax=Porphyrobacter sp. CACIAM 03H1 TaxID=2003315 RepID=UPI000B5A5D67|nr:hypothetical protein [Porphyrobacter sp. CACIAM 03H1]ASJ90274.1 hypothetical protein CBR61_04595 [Porphyrobacter sp. CACIAM 03H1]
MSGSTPIDTNATPKFYFFFDDESKGQESNIWPSGANTFVASPAEFTLVEFESRKGRREARAGSLKIAGAKSGVMDKDRIPFSSKEVRPGHYEVTPAAPLPPGEYCFIFSLGAGGTNSAMTVPIFDFSVR